MGVISELDRMIDKKARFVEGQLRKEGLRPVGGCFAVALDALLLGELPIDIYFREMKRAIELRDAMALIIGVSLTKLMLRPELLKQETYLTVNTSRQMALSDETRVIKFATMTNRQAWDMAGRTAKGENSGVIVMRDDNHHAIGLSGIEGKVLRFDGMKRRFVQSISLSQTVGLLRLGQRKGFVVEMR